MNESTDKSKKNSKILWKKIECKHEPKLASYIVSALPCILNVLQAFQTTHQDNDSFFGACDSFYRFIHVAAFFIMSFMMTQKSAM